MSERIDEFCENLRVKLTGMDNNMQSLKHKLDGDARTAEHDVQAYLKAVKNHIDQERAKVTAAQADIKKWSDQQKATASEKIAEWKNKREISKLIGRADDAERYAQATTLIMMAAADEAEQASLEAWLARRDAEIAQATKAV